MASGRPSESGAGFDTGAFLRTETEQHRMTFEATISAIAQPFARILDLCEGTVRNGGKLLWFGNGGSAADAQHLAAELVVRYKADRPAIPAIALTTDTSVLTACGNDLGFEAVFARQVDALARAGDVVLGLSTSGRSPNVLDGLRAARNRSAHVVGFAGGDGGSMRELCDEIIVVPSKITARIQEMHIMVGHMLCSALEQRLGLV